MIIDKICTGIVLSSAAVIWTGAAAYALFENSKEKVIEAAASTKIEDVPVTPEEKAEIDYFAGVPMDEIDYIVRHTPGAIKAVKKEDHLDFLYSTSDNYVGRAVITVNAEGKPDLGRSLKSAEKPVRRFFEKLQITAEPAMA